MMDDNIFSDLNTSGDELDSSNVDVSQLLDCDSQKGWLGKFVESPEKQWFVLRATYGRSAKAYDVIVSDNEEAYMPMHVVYRVINGKRQHVIEPLIPNIIFVYATPEYVTSLVQDKLKASYINFYRNHFKLDSMGNNPPLTIAYNDMMNFIKVTSIYNEHVMIVDRGNCRFKSGDMVKIVYGDFKGVVGRVARVAKQQRVIVEIEGLCLIATAYIPSAFLENVK